MRPVPASLRAAVFARDGGCCVICGRGLDPDHFEAHHRRMRSAGGRHELANLLTTCFADHQRVHAAPTLSMSRGWLVSRYGPGPDLVPVLFWDGEFRTLTNEQEAAA